MSVEGMTVRLGLTRYCKVALLALALVASGSLYANKKSRTANSNKGERKSMLTAESTMTRDRRKIDFNKAINIDGQRRDPLGALLNQKQADKNFEFIKMRLRWHKEMVDSAYDLTL